MKYAEKIKEVAKRWNEAGPVPRIKDFVRRWAREIFIAVVLAVAAAVLLDWYSERRADLILSANSRATVVITAISKDGEQRGSGFFINKDGLVATNYHVIKGADIQQITAQLPATRAMYRAKVVMGADEKRDVALVQFDARETPYVRLGDSSAIKAGERVTAIGAPLGLENSVSDGIVSNPERKIAGATFIQFTAPISPGNSGGGLFEKRGNVIGVTTATIRGTEQEPGQNINLAVPINVVRDTMTGKESGLTTDSPAYYVYLAEREEDLDKALAYYMKAISLDDTYADAYLGVGDLYYEKGDYDLSIKYYQEAAALAPDDYSVVSRLGSAYEDLGKYGEAIKMFRKAIELKPDDKDDMYTLARLSIVTGDIQTAREVLPSLMRLNKGIGKEIKVLIDIASGANAACPPASKQAAHQPARSGRPESSHLPGRALTTSTPRALGLAKRMPVPRAARST